MAEGWKITCEGLTVRYKTGESQTTALHKFSGSFVPGKITVVFGPSGSGKTTLLKAVGTLLKPTEGRVGYNGKNPYELPKKELLALRREIGISFQQPVFVSQLTLWENIELVLNSSGKLNDDHRDLAVDLAERLGIEKLLSKKPTEVSGGELRRASIVMALAKDPSVVILDEPTAYLDEESSERVVEILRELREKGKTIVVSTHDPELIRIADVTYRLRYGRVVGSEMGS
ncbi:ABC transporter ATP-binding protein [Thermococcus gammatolerans]|uniref:ABC-type transporter, ATP binding protein n=1 Tax=Thermococcus gammatolerans (strain DSM 15229 / JCM 11827 / EJ3) TaxID=593117 RepID=C5A6U1_THEGJ|nr:ATP-binding cassette domain-containing protein [Thermococcus gammatolerans]ACS33953.1 ABC-type transporter, ATP binding protein [Thermococcus gammatolerans EJ3]